MFAIRLPKSLWIWYVCTHINYIRSDAYLMTYQFFLIRLHFTFFKATYIKNYRCHALHYFLTSNPLCICRKSRNIPNLALFLRPDLWYRKYMTWLWHACKGAKKGDHFQFSRVSKWSTYVEVSACLNLTFVMHFLCNLCGVHAY